MYWSVTKAKPLDDYQLELTFEAHEVKIFDMKPYLELGVFKALKDKSFFQKVRVSFGSIAWPGGIDLDPEVLYEDGKTQAVLGVAEESGIYSTGKYLSEGKCLNKEA